MQTSTSPYGSKKCEMSKAGGGSTVPSRAGSQLDTSTPWDRRKVSIGVFLSPLLCLFPDG